jgi:hypothetical protein
MPAKSKKQRKFMGAELARKRAGKKTKTGTHDHDSLTGGIQNG